MILNTDSYKFSHLVQYPLGTKGVNAYIEARKLGHDTIFFGLQAFIKEYLLNPITHTQIDEAKELVTAHGLPFYENAWRTIVDELGGRLPVEITAVPEGLRVPTGNVLVQIQNTDERFFWLPGYLETALLRAVWYPTTVASNSFKLKMIIQDSLKETSDSVIPQLLFKLHDFGARGVSSEQSAMLGGMAHLVNFMGTDTVSALVGARKFYNETMAGFSIPASEHSTIISWGKDQELEAYENMIDQFAGPGKLYACVSDSYDIHNAVDNIWGQSLKDKVQSKGGTLVVRPDSGNPTTVPVTVIKSLMRSFGYTTNKKGYRVLPDCIRVIQGDGITMESLPKLIQNLKDAKLSIDNIAFGMGGGLLQNVNRDTYDFAMKASAVLVEDKWIDINKSPVHGGKTSKQGVLALVNECGIGYCGPRTIKAKDLRPNQFNILRTVYKNGQLMVEDTFKEIRDRTMT